VADAEPAESGPADPSDRSTGTVDTVEPDDRAEPHLRTEQPKLPEPDTTAKPETPTALKPTVESATAADTVESERATEPANETHDEPVPEGVPELEAKPEPGTMPELKITPEPREKPQQEQGPAGQTGAATPPVAVADAQRAGRQRRVRPIRAARDAGRSTVDWARRPNGRLALPAIFAALLIAAAGTAGAFLVPRAMTSTSAVARQLPEASAPAKPSAGPSFPSNPVPSAETGPTGTAGPVDAGARPADALAGWAQQVGTRVGVPVVAVQAYGYAELVLKRTQPSCHLSWTTLAAIGKVESAHGSANGAVLGTDGMAMPAIVGLPLDGKGGRQLIRDTDGGALDTDRTFDRAMGPMQFVPTTWRENAVDADNNGVTDPNDIDDASLAAATYLCRDGRDMAKPEDWWEGILSYNDVRPYAQKVFTEANTYGLRSRT
jgi:membrane-bound lytic murein transglycosylase B